MTMTMTIPNLEEEMVPIKTTLIQSFYQEVTLIFQNEFEGLVTKKFGSPEEARAFATQNGLSVSIPHEHGFIVGDNFSDEFETRDDSERLKADRNK